MKNPWTMKNPFMSMWLSGANAIAGSLRSQAQAQANRQVQTMMTNAMQETVRFWSAGLMSPPPSTKRKRRR